MKNILVTGGAGFIGSHTVIELVKAGYNPIVLDNFSNSEPFIVDRIKALSDTHITVYEGDCRDEMILDQIFSDHEILGIIHFAAYKAVGESFEKPLAYHHNNVGSTLQIMKSVETYQVKNLVFSSSCTVYGDPSSCPVSEDSEQNPPTSPYGSSKVYCEKIINDYHSKNPFGFSSMMLRYFNPVGAHPSGKIGELPLGAPNNLLPYITQTAVGKRNELLIFGDDYPTPDGTCLRDYVHVVDIARAHVLAMNWSIANVGKIDHINLGLGKGTSVLEIVKLFEEVSEQSLNYRIVERRQGDVAEVWATFNKAKEVLGWSPEYSVKDAVQHAWTWQKTLTK